MQNHRNAPLRVGHLGFSWNFRKHLYIIDRRIVGLTCPGHHMLVESRASRLLKQFRSAKLADVLGRGQVGLAPGLPPGHPPPAQRIAGRVRIEQMTEKMPRAEFPGQPAMVDPIRSPPHARVIVQVTGLEQFAREMIHNARGRAACGHFAAGRGNLRIHGGIRSTVTVPDPRTPFQPPFPIAAPQHLL